ncbi:hypothetical protein OROHE_024456 [Orobanche hederae]
MSLLIRSLPAVAHHAKSSLSPHCPLHFLIYRRRNLNLNKLFKYRAFSSIFTSTSEPLGAPTPKQHLPSSADADFNALEWVSRTALCGQLSDPDVGKRVRLCGWVALHRVHGGLTFLSLRDHTGIVQVTTLPGEFPEAHSAVNDLRLEYVIAVEGVVMPRPVESINKKMKTGHIEIADNGLDGYTEKLVHAASKGSKVRFGTWNIGSLTGRAAEVGEVMKRRRIHIMCLQETKWVGEKARVLAPWGYKLWYSRKDRSRNGVGIVIDKEMIDDVVEVSRKSDRIMSIRLVIGDEFLTIISAYAPQVGLDASIKQEFWEDLEEVVERIPMGEKLIIGGDLNGHVGVSRDGFESVHGGFGFEDMNEAANGILDFALAYDLGIMNTWFEKRDSHLVTYRNGGSASQIDFFLVRNVWRKSFTNCKVIPGESAATQHRVVVLAFEVRDS